ncbi:tyrosine-type recombinase/integrase [Longispora sp. NPDC051575]|uniref:tyrosine-type recombinase/integrase n=1 Tax=Longispora sp. NPDC051575 TaxID=3154943 RepID=UPI0034127AFB
MNGAWRSGHGIWAYQLELPRASDGRRRQLRRAPHAEKNSKAAALAERDLARGLLFLAGDDEVAREEIVAMLRAVRPGMPLPDRDTVARRLRAGVCAAAGVTVAEYLTTWVDGRQIDEKTKANYRGHIRNYFVPHLGHLALDRLTRAHITAMFTTVTTRNAAIRAARNSTDPSERAGVRGQKTVSAASMHRIRATLRKALNDAIVKDRLLEFNPATHVELPTAERPIARVWTPARVAQWLATGVVPSSVMVWTPEQAGAFLDYVQVHDLDLYPVFAFILKRGPRRGEALGVRADQIDRHTATAVISHQVALHGGSELVYKKVKTRSGDRIIALDTDTVIDLGDYLQRRAAQKAAAGSAWPHTVRMRTPMPDGGDVYVDVDLFFRRPDGGAWNPDLVSERFQRHVRHAGLPPVGIHDGRHAAATFTKAAGGDLKEIQELLGHSHFVTTADTYTSLLQEVERVTAERTARLIPRNRPRTA